MISPRDKFASTKEMVGNRLLFSRERVADMERPVRCIVSPSVSLSQRWHMIQHKKFP